MMVAMNRPTYHSIPVDADFMASTCFVPALADKTQPAPIVVCTHGLTGSRMGSCYRLVRLAQRLVADNIACLTFDFRGCGESDGDFIDVTCERLQRDLRAVIDWIIDNPDFDATRIGLCGSSFGAFTASRVAPSIPGLRALVYWSGVANPRHLYERAMNHEAWALLNEQGWLPHRGMPLGKSFFSVAPGLDDGPAALAAAGKPLLMFHATGDTEVPISHAEAYQQALGAAGVDVRLERLDLPDHGMRDVVLNERILEGTAAWFADRLRA